MKIFKSPAIFVLFTCLFSAMIVKGEFQKRHFKISQGNVKSGHWISFESPWNFYSPDCMPESACFKELSTNLQIQRKRSVFQLGSPGFYLCRQIGGRPELITMEASEVGKFKTSWCQLKGGSQFMSIDALVSILVTKTK
jgi:hypothetical protein